MRDAWPGLRLQINLGAGSFKTQFKRADKSGAELALVLGEDELARGVVAIKSLRQERAQEECPLDQISERCGLLLGLYKAEVNGALMAEEYLTDDEQLEHVKRLFTEYGPWVIGAVIVGLGLAFGYRYYVSHLNRARHGCFAQFADMNSAVQRTMTRRRGRSPQS